MERGRHSPTCLLLILFLLFPFTLLLSPPLAATGLEQGEPVLTVLPAMNYHPPLGAAQLSEFLKPLSATRPGIIYILSPLPMA
ncbi:MAG: hypothetical protein KJ063_03435 [Anaerolineae bacterium]|nr:hypothetical protein [Anaerolineae bacterium]